jgi:ribonuclease Z
MTEVIILGSGTPNPDPGRAGSAVAIVADDGWVLVDCGRAATQRATDAGLDLRALVVVALTHHHSDHLSDLSTLATARWVAGATTPLTIVAPAGPTTDFAERCLDGFVDESFYAQGPSSGGTRPTVVVQPIEAPSEPAEVFAGGEMRLSSVLVDHHPVEPAVAYLVETGGHRIVISGDTAVCSGMRVLARGVDVLVHEALLTSRVRPALLEWNAGSRQIGELAASVDPGVLVLTHLIPAPRSTEDEVAYVEEVRAGGFEGTTIVARDLLHIPVQKPGGGS